MHKLSWNSFFPARRVCSAPIRLQVRRPEQSPDCGSGLKARLALGSGFADPVVLVDTRPGEGERGSIGLEAFLSGELGGRTSDWRSLRWERLRSESLPLLPEPGLRSTGRKLTELRRRGGRLEETDTTDWNSNDSLTTKPCRKLLKTFKGWPGC